MKQFFGAAILIAALAACSGGGGGVTPPSGGGTQSNAKLAVGFAIAPKGAFARTASIRYQPATRRQLDASSPTLGGGVLPFATFWVADSYVPASAFPTIGYSEVAYATGGTPSPGPVTFTNTSGPALPVLATPSPLPQPAGLPSGAVILGGQIVGAPSQVGQSIVTVSAIGQTATLTADTFPGTALSDPSGNSLAGPTGLTFTASGAAPTTGGTPDLAISGDGVSASSFVAPGGIIEIPNKTLDAVTTSDYVAANAQTTLTPATLCSSGQLESFILKTQGGLLVKFQTEGLYFSGNQANGVCAFTDFPAIYQVAGSGGFPF